MLHYNTIKPYLVLFIGIIGMTFSPFFVTWAKAPGIIAAFYRLFFATIMVLPWALPALKAELSKRQSLYWCALAGILFAADIAVWNMAVLRTTVTNATLFNNISVLWVGLTAWIIFKRNLGLFFWWGLGLAFIGITIILHKDTQLASSNALGDLLAVIASVAYAGFFISMEHARRELSVLTSFFVAAAVGTIMLLLVIPFTHLQLFGYSGHTYMNFIAMALITQVMGYIAINYTLGHLPATIVSPSVLLQPIFAAILSMLLLGESSHDFQVVGGVLVLVGIFMVHRAKSNG